jgi:methyl-accepting chemotaxis protein
VGKARQASLLIGIAGLAVIILFIWLFFHFLVNKKIRMVLDATHDMRRKDFSKSYEIRKGDEINHILSRINLVTQDLRQTFKQFSDHSDTIFHSASELSLISKDLNSASTDTSQKATTVSSASEEMSINNRSIAASMEQATDSLNAVASAIEQMSATVGEIARNVNATKEITEQVAQGFDMITGVVDELGKRANDVDLVTDEIRAISEQVGMLALNAKIEAARAGAAGKGFAVVAQEITELADETNKSTLEADEKLRWIKEKSKEVVEKVAGLTTVVKESEHAIAGISAAVEEQNTTTREIAKNITDVSADISEVNTSVAQGALVAAEIAKDITLVEEGARKVRSGSGQLNDNAARLSSMAENFREIISNSRSDLTYPALTRATICFKTSPAFPRIRTLHFRSKGVSDRLMMARKPPDARAYSGIRDAGWTRRVEPMTMNASLSEESLAAFFVSSTGMAWPKEMVSGLKYPPQEHSGALFPDSIISSASFQDISRLQPMHLTRRVLPWSSIIFSRGIPEASCKPSIFWVMSA